MKLLHKCKGPNVENYACGTWINLGIGWWRIWPLRRKNACWGTFFSRKEARPF